MKKLASVFAIILILASSCSKDGLKSDLDDSRDAWLSFKKSNSNSYSYTVAYGSWTGSSSTTTLVVVNGIVTERIYKAYYQEGSEKKLVKSWSEDQISLNSHQEGATTWTLDEVYRKAKEEWLAANKEENTLYLETNNNGMISLCGYVPKNCADDCLRGIHISEIKPLVDGRFVQ